MNIPDIFVPSGSSRKETAILLVGTADEFGIDQHSIRTTSGGFLITQELHDAVYGEDGEVQAEAQDAADADEPDLPPYEEWDYQDLKSEVATRELEVENHKAETLVAALVADDEANADGDE